VIERLGQRVVVIARFGNLDDRDGHCQT